MLAKVTGYQDMSTPELSVAIKAAQRMVSKANGGSGLSSSSISTGSGSGSSHKAHSAGSADSPTNSSSPTKQNLSITLTTAQVAAEVLKRVNTAGSDLCHAPSSVSLASTYQTSQTSGNSLSSGAGGGVSEPLNIEGNALTAANQAALLAALEKNGASGGLSHLSALTSNGLLTPVTMSNLTQPNVNSSSNTSGGADSSGDRSNGSDQSSADAGGGNELDMPGATAAYLAEAALAD
jgi:hypothetical protein